MKIKKNRRQQGYEGCMNDLNSTKGESWGSWKSGVEESKITDTYDIFDEGVEMALEEWREKEK